VAQQRSVGSGISPLVKVELFLVRSPLQHEAESISVGAAFILEGHVLLQGSSFFWWRFEIIDAEAKFHLATFGSDGLPIWLWDP
jgi:hypothetical protein